MIEVDQALDMKESNDELTAVINLSSLQKIPDFPERSESLTATKKAKCRCDISPLRRAREDSNPQSLDP